MEGLCDGIISTLHDSPSSQYWSGQYHASQNNLGVSSAPALIALQHSPCPTHNYRRHRAGVPVMARLQRGHLSSPSVAACLALSPPLPARRLRGVGAGQMSGIVFCLFCGDYTPGALLHSQTRPAIAANGSRGCMSTSGHSTFLPVQDTAGALYSRTWTNWNLLLPSRKQ